MKDMVIEMLNIIIWSLLAILNWFNPNLDMYPKIIITWAAVMIIAQIIIIRKLKDRKAEN